MPSKTNITISDLLVNFPCKYDRLSLRTHFSSEYAKLTGKNVSQMAFQGLTTEFLNIFVKKHNRNKQSFYRYETRVLAKIVNIPKTAEQCDQVLPTSEDKPACQKTPILQKRKSFEDLCRTQKKRRLDNVEETS